MTEILGVKIDDKNEADFLKIIEERLFTEKKTFIVTPNPEMLILAQKDREFLEILNKADISIPDGYGLKAGARIMGGNLKNRVTGTDLMQSICKLLAGRYSIYLLGGELETARKAAENLKIKYPTLQIAGAESGGKLEEWDNRVIVEHINVIRPDILFVALGHGRQEKWIFENFEKLPSVKLAMGVGGAFDFISGKIIRAPRAMRIVGLEWLWRLMMEPGRWQRIANAVIVFPWICWTKKNQRS